MQVIIHYTVEIENTRVSVFQGSETRVHTQKNPPGFFGVYPPKNPPKNPPQLKCNFVFCATNNEVFYCF